MTLDPDLPLTDDELAVAAVVDGDATAAQRRRVARDPGLVAQVRAAEAAIAAIEAPMLAPAEDVLAALRARAVAEGTATTDTLEEEAVVPVPADPTPPATPDRLAARRARRPRRLPPLPAVAAVVLVLLLGGIALLVTDDRASNDQRAEQSTATAGSGASGGSEQSTATDGASSGDAAAADAPVAQLRDELLARATSSYTDEAQLLDALRTVDPETLDLNAVAGEASPTTTAVPDGTDPPASTSGAVTGADGRSLAGDDAVLRCDNVLRSSEPTIGAVTAATFVSVDGVPVLVLSNPVEATDEAAASIYLTVFNAIDCSPRGAVQR